MTASRVHRYETVTAGHDTAKRDHALVTVTRITHISVDVLIHDYAEWMASWGASPQTIAHRLVLIQAMFKRCGPPEAVTTAALVQWLATPTLSAWSRRTYFNHAHSFFQWAVHTGRLSTDPTANMRRPVQPRGVPRPFADHELDRILEAATGRVSEFITLGLYAGLRAHEIAKIRGEDVTHRTLYVKGKGAHEAHLPTHPAIWELAQTKPQRGYWFPSSRAACGHVMSSSVSRMVSRLLFDLGIEGSIHRCRHTYGTRLLRQGTNIRVVQQLMRHQSLASTELYLAVEDDELSKAIAGLVA